MGKAVEDAALCRRPIPAQLLHRQALPWHQCPFALVERIQLPILAYIQAGPGIERHRPQRRARNTDYFYKQLPGHSEKDEEGAGEDERAPFVLCHYTVFNVEQCDGLTLPEISQPVIAPEIDEDELCESIITGWESRPAFLLNSLTEYHAYYRPSADSVHMPARSRFVDAPHYYSTLFHELVHSTGHESRLNRAFGDRFGDELYSKEELVAEMGAAFLGAIAGIANEHTDRNTTAYIQNWISKLEEDNRLIVHAAANAQRAVDMILGSTFEEENETNDNAGDAANSGIPAAVAMNISPAVYGHAHL